MPITRVMRALFATLLLLLMHVGEIAGRRLLWFAAATERFRALRLPRLAWPQWTRRSRPASTTLSGPAAVPTAPSPRVESPKPATSALARAKAKARNRLGH